MPVSRLSPWEEARELTEFNREVFDRYARRVSRLSWSEATRDRETGHHSLFQTLVHVLHVQEVWLVYIVRGRNRELPRLFRDPRRSPKSWKEFREYSRRVWSEIDQTVSNLGDRDFARRVKAPWMPGRYTVRDAFFQTTFEEAHHVGEVIGALWQDDREPPVMMWIPILRSGRSRPRRRRIRRRV